jgi:hypothetical protein
MTWIAIPLAFGFLAAIASADQTYRITLTDASKIGTTELQPGDYKLVVDASKVVLTDLRNDKSIELEARIENMDEKVRATEVHSDRADGDNHITEIRLGGSKTRIVFD